MKKIILPILILSLSITGLWLISKVVQYEERVGADPRVLTVRQGGTGQSRFASGTLIYGNEAGDLTSTSSPVVGAIYATSTTASSTFVGTIIGKGLKLDNYASCNLDTDSNGFIQCGTDATAVGAWTADQDADGYDLFDVANLTATSGTWTIGTTSPAFTRPFAVQGGGFFAGNLTSANFHATGTVNAATLNSYGGLFASGTAAISGLSYFYDNLLATGASSTITNLNVINATSTGATSTALYVSGASIFTGASTTISGTLQGQAINGLTLQTTGGVFASGTSGFSQAVGIFGGSALRLYNPSNSEFLSIALNASNQLSINYLSLFSADIIVTGASSTITNLDVSDALQIPNAAGGGTVNALGEITIDDTSNTLNFYEGAAERVLNPKKIFGFTVASTTPFERWALPFTVDYAFTVSEVRAKMSCTATTSPSAAFCAGGYDFNFSHGASQNSTSTLLSENSGQLVNTISTSSLTSHTTFNDATIAANEEWFFYVMTASSSNDSMVVQVYGYQDP